MTGPARYNIGIYRGDTWSMKVTILDSAQQPSDLTGGTIAAQARSPGPDGELLFDFVVTITDPTTGIAVLSLPAGANLDQPQTVYDLQLTTAAALVRTLLAGSVTRTADVTR